MLWIESPRRWAFHHVWHFLLGVRRCQGPGGPNSEVWSCARGAFSSVGRGKCVSSEPDSTFECHSETELCHNMYEEWLFL